MQEIPAQSAAAPHTTSASLHASNIPRATYRLQLHRDFGFDAAARIAPYLAQLGVSHVYVSPILMSRPGSRHGYDLVDYERIDPELGGRQGLLRLSSALKSNGLGLIVDIVPNHMGVGGEDNHWWLSVLEWGKASPFAGAFDIDWERPGAEGKLIIPVLGAAYGEVLERGEMRLCFDAEEGSFSIRYGEHLMPLTPPSYGFILDKATGLLNAPAGDPALRQAIDAAGQGDVRASEQLKRTLAEQVVLMPDLASAIEQVVEELNGMPGDETSFDALDELIARQHWRAAYWGVAASEINYRRFFDINLLAGIRVENPWVFEATHQTILTLVREGRVQGLRIDHIDGLADPAGYLRKLRQEVGPEIYIVVEKILEPGETLQPWPVAGTTGYDALNLIDGVLLDRKAKAELRGLYLQALGATAAYHAELRDAKRLIVESLFISELESLVGDAKIIADSDRRTRDMTRHTLRAALIELIIALPVYRSYLDDGPIAESDRLLLERTVEAAKDASEFADTHVHDFLLCVLLGDGAALRSLARVESEARRLRQRFQQLTGPVMAKSLEDTLFYRYAPLIALNEVGGDPGRFGVPLQEFHEAMRSRVATWPAAMIATATHDTKRGEDARARLLAIADDPAGFAQALKILNEQAAVKPDEEKRGEGPDAVDRLILLQSILGAWPLDLLLEDGPDEKLAGFRQRMKDFSVKALREAKRHSSWRNPDVVYEESVARWLDKVIAPASPILAALRGYAQDLAYRGMRNSIMRTVLKFTLPGVPDIFQGTELWDLSLVDPDNRRPVDYDRRMAGMDDARDRAALLRDWHDGVIKQRLTRILLQDRAENPDVYLDGDYEPLQAEGRFADHVIAFSRSHAADRLVTICCRAPETARVGGQDDIGMPLKDTILRLPRIGIGWRDLVTNRTWDDDVWDLSRLDDQLRVAVLRQGA